MILVSHEIPRMLFPQHDAISDYPYVLAHLLMEETPHYDAAYASFYKEKLAERPIFSILDNSCFELGASVNIERLIDLCYDYQPTHLVLPDIMSDMEGTKRCVNEFLNEWHNKEVKLIGVLQGKGRKEYFEMLEFYEDIPAVDIIAVNMREIEPGYSRLDFITESFLNPGYGKKFHLLGCISPNEFAIYSDSIKSLLIHSIDTSAPIIHGMRGTRFDYDPAIGYIKPLEKLADNLSIVLTATQYKDIMHNVKVCRHFIHNSKEF